MRQSADVVVVGAGLAGLAAASRLAHQGLDVLVLEARDRVGGRTLNGRLPNGAPIELGAQFVGPTQDAVLRLLADLGLETFPVHDVGRHVLERGGEVRTYAGRTPRIDPLGLIDAGIAWARLERLARCIRAGSMSVERERALDAMSARDWAAGVTRTRLGRSFVTAFVEGVLAAEPEQVSMRHLAAFVGACGGLGVLTKTSGGAQQDRVVGGTQAIAERLAERLADRVVLSTPVEEVEWEDDRARLRSGTRTFEARRAIVTVPIALAREIRWEPSLPDAKTRLLERARHGSVIKCFAVYERPWWRERGLSGQAASFDGPVTATFDNTPPEGAPGVLMAFVEAANADRLRSLDEQDRRSAVLAGLVRLFGPNASRVEDYLEHDWTTDPWTKGCYGAFLPPGSMRYGFDAWRRSIGALCFAGTETADRWPLYMDGAVRSGERAATEAASAFEPLSP
jgi:monoamine oxidase